MNKPLDKAEDTFAVAWILILGMAEKGDRILNNMYALLGDMNRTVHLASSPARRNSERRRELTATVGTADPEFICSTPKNIDGQNLSRVCECAIAVSLMPECERESMTITAASMLPQGWEWHDWDDGSGALYDPQGQSVFGYDSTSYPAEGCVEYYRERAGLLQSWQIFYDSLSRFKAWAEQSVRASVLKC